MQTLAELGTLSRAWWKAIDAAKAQAVEALTGRIITAIRAGKVTIADLGVIANVCESGYRSYPSTQSPNAGLSAAFLRAQGVQVRVAEWHIVNNRCEHKRYALGNNSRARFGEIGEETWLEAWIA